MAAQALIRAALALIGAAFAASAFASVEVEDDFGNKVVLKAPATRIASLAPHATELLFAAGAGSRIVAVGAFSDFPQEAARLPVVSDAFAINTEALLAARPDVVVLWHSGSSPKQREQLRALGLPVFVSEPKRLGDITSSVMRLAKLAGTEAAAAPAVARLTGRVEQLRNRFASARPVPTLVAMGDASILTFNREHFVSDVITLCGGVNVFADHALLAPQVPREAIVAAAPEVIIRPAGAKNSAPPKSWQTLPLPSAKRIHAVNADWLLRPAPRLIDAAERVCEIIDEARKR
jgi:iron complex transport system substrate-binding protein